MGDVIELRRQGVGCSWWQQGHASINLAARPTCASLAMAFAALAAPMEARDIVVAAEGLHHV